MVALLGALIIGVLLLVILTNRMSPLAALILVPIVGAALGGFGPHIGGYVSAGIVSLAPMAAMFLFAILFFGVLTDAGLLEPIITRVLRLVGEKPVRIAMASTLLALLVHLDGSGAVCFLVVIPTMLPLYDRLGMDRRVLACTVSMAAGVNFLPWTGPMVRASSALGIPVLDIFRPLIPVQLVGLVAVFAFAAYLGRREAVRLAAVPLTEKSGQAELQIAGASMAAAELRRPHLFWPNLALALAVMTALVVGLAAPAVVFMIGTALALVINYRTVREQRERIEAHARAAVTMAAILLAAGVLTGVLTGTGALKALATTIVGVVPPGSGHHIPFALSLLAMPLSMVFDPDSFYFGVLPVIAEIHRHLGGEPIQVAQAALLGQMTAGFPVSPLTPATFLVAGLCGLELSAHQRYAFPFLYAASLCMALACVVLGVFPV